MATFTTSCVITEITPNCGMKEIIVATPLDTTGVSGDAVSFTLADYGISNTGLLTVEGTTVSSIYGTLVRENPTTAVSSGVLTITSGTLNGVKTYRILGEGN